MILLDTDVLSALMREVPEPISWLDKQVRGAIWTTSVTVFEIRYGLQSMPLGKRRTLAMAVFERLLDQKIAYRIAPFDTAAAHRAAELMANRRKAGRPVESRDTMIAGIALATQSAIATRNVRHFADLTVPVINPWDM